MKLRNWGLFIIGLLLLGACARSVPGQPQEVSIVKETGGLRIKWKDTSSGETQETGFVVKRNGEDGETKFTTKPDITEYLDTSAVLTESYTYRVCALIGGKEVCSKEANFPDTGGGKVTLTILREGGGSGVITSTPAGISCNHVTGSGCSASFNKGTTVTLTAAPNSGSSLLGYSENCEKTGDLTCQIVMDSDKEVTETMVEAGPGLNIALSGDLDAGVVVDLNTSPRFEYINCGSDCNEPLPEGTVVVVEARPTTDAIFGGWENCPKIEGATGNRCRVTLAAVTIIGASFYKNTSKPTIESFTATPTQIATGETGDVTLNWTINAPVASAVTGISIANATSEVCATEVLELVDSCVVEAVGVSTTFTLTVESPFGTETATATVSVGDAATITKFEVVGKTTPVTIAKGDTITLSWGVAGADPLSVTLNDEPVAADGSRDVTPEVSTVYTLTADNAFGEPVSQSISVTVGEKPVINSFGASDTTVRVGETSILSWDVEPADATITFEPSIGAFTGNSKELTFSEEGVVTYTLTAENTFGTTVSEPVVITVGRAPEITKFTATPPAIPSDGSVSSTLEWTVSGTAPVTLSIDRGVGTVTGTSTSVTPDETTTYILTATNDFGTDTEDVTVEVGNPPSIILQAESAGDEGTRLFWSIDVDDGAELTALRLNPGDIDVLGDSERIVNPTETTTYELTATNRFGSTTEEIIVDVSSPPVISRFRANPDEVKEGRDTTLEWRVSDAESLTLQYGSSEQKVTGDRIKVFPSRTTVYTLIAKNKSGETSSSVQVEVDD